MSEHRNPVLAVTIPLDNLRGQFLTLFQDGSHVEQVLKCLATMFLGSTHYSSSSPTAIATSCLAMVMRAVSSILGGTETTGRLPERSI